MSNSLRQRLVQSLTNWLMKERPYTGMQLSDFDRLRYEIRPCDVLLVEGQSRVSDVIRIISQSPWTHSMLYIGRLHDIENPLLRQRIREVYQGDEGEQLVIESMLGKDTVVTPLSRYKHIHMRICRPKGISREDAQRVIGYTIGRLGLRYGVRQLLDLARFMFPWSVLPRRWRSTLFRHNAGEPTRQICSSLIAEAFSSVHFPILPILTKTDESGLQLVPRNPRLFTPSDFDYSPFFEIIKYPFFGLSEEGMYRNLPWAKEGEYSNDDGSTINLNEPQRSVPTTSSEPDAETVPSGTTEKTKHGWFKRNKK